MNRETQKRLEDINFEFYNSRAEEFAKTRARPWTGWEIVWTKIQNKLPEKPVIIDIGCGNGRFGEFFLKGYGPDFTYIGVEPVKALADMAMKNLASIKKKVIWNFTAKTLPPILGDIVVAFGVMHHLPGKETRIETIREFNKMVKPNGLLVLSFWQAKENTNLIKRRAKDKELKELGLEVNELEANDLLLPFNHEKDSWRYVHAFTAEEIDFYKTIPGKTVADFKADGPTNSANRYLLWQTSPPPQIESQ